MKFLIRQIKSLPIIFQVAWTVVAFTLISFLPSGSTKRGLNNLAFKTTFRIFARALSSVLTFHNIEYKPKRGGFCVANHTTPIDVVMLSTESCFSLVGINSNINNISNIFYDN